MTYESSNVRVFSITMKGNASPRNLGTARQHQRPRMQTHAHNPKLFEVDGLEGRLDDYQKFFETFVAGHRAVVPLPGSTISEQKR